jgi:tripartite-type tricarboxylate transporter receptor subunit TctC
MNRGNLRVAMAMAGLTILHPGGSGMRRLGLVCASFLAASISLTSACAETVEEFYRGKTITVVVTGATGSIYDLSARLVTRYMSEHLPGKPTMVIKMMVGGGHLVGTNWLYNVAPRDGTVLASIGEAIPLTQVLEPEQAKFDVSKFNWLGNPGLSNLVLSTWADKGVKTIEDAKKKQVIIGAGGPTSPSGQMPRALNNVLGTKFKIIVGFPSTSIDLAMERGEVDGRGSAQVSYYKTVRPHWVTENKLNYLVQWGPKRDPDLPDVPLLTELARNEAERQVFALLSSTVIVGRPILTTPDVPADRLAALKDAFAKTMQDPNFLEEAKKLNLEINPLYADEMQKLINDVIATPPDVVKLAKAAISEGEVFDCKKLVKDAKLCEEKK